MSYAPSQQIAPSRSFSGRTSQPKEVPHTMALTLAEAAKLSNDVLLTGVVETIIKDSPVLQRLPFIEIVETNLWSLRRCLLLV